MLVNLYQRDKDVLVDQAVIQAEVSQQDTQVVYSQVVLAGGLLAHELRHDLKEKLLQVA